jgi:nicotinamidase-related amidase
MLAVKASSLPLGPLTETAVHICIDMQRMFAEQTAWHVPWMKRVVPAIFRIARIVDKHFYSPFAEPELHRLLQDCGVDDVVISGGQTDVCVLAAVLDAIDLGYRVVVASDAVCSISDEAHDNLTRLFSERFKQQIEVVSSEVILAAWA